MMNQPTPPSIESTGNVIKSFKIDPITAVQDSIDSLSLSLFEALRGLRDAVSPEASQNNNNGEGSSTPAATLEAERRSVIDREDMDYEDFLIAYSKDDPFALELIKTADGKPPRNREEYAKLRAKNDMKKHAELVPKLAENVLSKSAAVDDLIATLPGMQRTKAEQMARIQELLDQNQRKEEDLQLAYSEAEKKRNELRSVLQRVTCKALNIQEE